MGNMALAETSNNKVYENRLIQIGESLDWNTDPKRFYVDIYCVGQVYSMLFKKIKRQNDSSLQTKADNIIPKPDVRLWNGNT